MKRNFHCLVLMAALVVLTGCETAKYTLDQTFSDKREFGPNSRETEHHPSDIMLANADDWIRRNLW